ncbi:MAG TPA: pyruvate formate-lyase-activating protein [Vicinamibacterales bacterium]|nr:pyruvate formate-lyase-activating protein [Vicinamibacterales bacterium]
MATDTVPPEATPLEAESPYELRVNLGKDVPESDVRSALKNGDVGFLHSFTTGSAVDGPGVRVVAWTAGCMWRCLYCHNPDTWTMGNGIPVTIARARETLAKYRTGLQVMAGGLTLSGGEPLMQDRFVVKLLGAARQMGVHTALNTNGFYGSRLSDEELEVVSLVIMDLKAWDPARHKQLTGMDNGPTLDFARRLADRKRPVWLRFVVVPGLTDDVDDIRRIAAFAGSLGNVERLDVLPFHQMGRYKWHALGMKYSLETVEPPTPALMDQTIAIFKAEGIRAV